MLFTVMDDNNFCFISCDAWKMCCRALKVSIFNLLREELAQRGEVARTTEDVFFCVCRTKEKRRKRI